MPRESEVFGTAAMLSGEHRLGEFLAGENERIAPEIVVVRILHVQLNQITFDCYQGHRQTANQNGLSGHEVNLMKLHGVARL